MTVWRTGGELAAAWSARSARRWLGAVACALAWLAIAATGRAAGPKIRADADPCTATCVFDLCVGSRSRLVLCDDPCQRDLRVTMVANGSPRRKRRTVVKVPDPRHREGRPRIVRAALSCVRMPSDCHPCRSDADCDDGQPGTQDRCVVASGRCQHACP